jgi:muramoyltetrapeptide carboxypeptidase
LGFEVVRGPSCSAEGGLWAGTDRARADELCGYLLDPTVQAIFAGRGGVGSLRLLPLLDSLPVDLAPTWIVGRSDLTALHLAFWKLRRWVGLSGPMVATDFGRELPPPEELIAGTLRLLQETGPVGAIGGTTMEAWIEGQTEGVLVPANLSLICSMIGTPYLPSLKGSILLLEEIGEPPRRCDRMLTQLRLSGTLEGLAGLILGQFTDCREEPAEGEGLLRVVLKDHVASLAVPTLAGFPYGHEAHSLPLPIGTRATMQTNPPSLCLIESAAREIQEDQG